MSKPLGSETYFFRVQPSRRGYSKSFAKTKPPSVLPIHLLGRISTWVTNSKPSKETRPNTFLLAQRNKSGQRMLAKEHQICHFKWQMDNIHEDQKRPRAPNLSLQVTNPELPKGTKPNVYQVRNAKSLDCVGQRTPNLSLQVTDGQQPWRPEEAEGSEFVTSSDKSGKITNLTTKCFRQCDIST